MIHLHLDKYHKFLKTKVENDIVFIHDPVRNIYLKAQPEEYVRQLLLLYLIEDTNYGKNLISVEKSFIINGIIKRYDVVIYDRKLNPYILIECKAPEVWITQETFDQAFRYNIILDTPYLIVPNGHTTFCAGKNMDSTHYHFIDHIPESP